MSFPRNIRVNPIPPILGLSKYLRKHWAEGESSGEEAVRVHIIGPAFVILLLHQWRLAGSAKLANAAFCVLLVRLMCLRGGLDRRSLFAMRNGISSQHFALRDGLVGFFPRHLLSLFVLIEPQKECQNRRLPEIILQECLSPGLTNGHARIGVEKKLLPPFCHPMVRQVLRSSLGKARVGSEQPWQSSLIGGAPFSCPGVRRCNPSFPSPPGSSFLVSPQRGLHPPHGITSVIGNQERAIRLHGDSDWPTICLAGLRVR